MAYIDLDEDEQMAAPAPVAGGVASAPAQAGGAPAGKAGTGFVSFNQLLGLNAPGGQQMADAVTGDLAARATPQAAANPEQASDVRARANVLQQSGPGAALGEIYGNGRPYSSGEQAMDSALAGGVAGGAMRTAGGHHAAFGSLLGLGGPAQAQGGNVTDATGGNGGGPRTRGGPVLTGGPHGASLLGGPGLLDDVDRRRERSQGLAKDPHANPFGSQDDMRNPFARLYGGM